MKRIKVRKIKPNILFETWIEEWRDEAIAQNSELQYHFSKALEALRKYPLPLQTGKECILLQHFGSKLCAMLDKKLEQHLEKESNEVQDVPHIIQKNLNIDNKPESEETNMKNDKVIIPDDKLEINEPGCSKNVVIAPLDDDDNDDDDDNESLKSYPDCANIDEVPYFDTEEIEEERYSDEADEVPVVDTETKVRESSFSLMPNSFDIILLIDVQEIKGNEKQNAVTEQLKRERVLFEIRHLHIGDFTWIARCRNSNKELILPYIVERKRMDDLASSIKDGRYHEQKFRLKQSGIPNVIYMIEKLPDGNTHTSLPLTTLHQAAMNSLIQDEFSLRFTRNHRDSILYLSTFTQMLQRLFSDKLLVECDKENLPKEFNVRSEEMFLMEFEKFNKTSAKNKPLRVKDMFIKQLLQIKGLSLQGTLAIVERYPTPVLLKRAFDDAGDNGEKLLATLQYGRTNRKLGPVLSKIIYQFYTKEVLS